MGLKKENETVWYETLIIVLGVILIAVFKTCI